ncbi:hypothetical protein D9M68_557420 [compost metagenome]
MRKCIAFITLIIFTVIAFNACKKEEITTQQFVQRHIIGRWPLKARIEITSKNGDTTQNDTTRFTKDDKLFPIDTVIFSANGTYIIKESSFKYSVNHTGDSLSISSTPPKHWNIKFLRPQSIILSNERREKVGADIFIYYSEEQLIK